jgi:hypothetical protein
MQESELRNPPGGPDDSIGLFQQRPSQGWGTPAPLADADYAAITFFQALLKVPGWQTMALADAAQAVQKSAFPDAYARWEPEATVVCAATSHPSSTAATATARPKPLAAARLSAAMPTWGGRADRGFG